VTRVPACLPVTYFRYDLCRGRVPHRRLQPPAGARAFLPRYPRVTKAPPAWLPPPWVAASLPPSHRQLVVDGFDGFRPSPFYGHSWWTMDHGPPRRTNRSLRTIPRCGWTTVPTRLVADYTTRIILPVKLIPLISAATPEPYLLHGFAPPFLRYGCFYLPVAAHRLFCVLPHVPRYHRPPTRSVPNAFFLPVCTDRTTIATFERSVSPPLHCVEDRVSEVLPFYQRPSRYSVDGFG